MLIDTGAQISLINNKKILDKSAINTNRQITIKSIHGEERTLGEVAANIQVNQTKIPIRLQVTKNQTLKEDGIIGYDIISKGAVINGPEKRITLKNENKIFQFPICSEENDLATEIKTLNNIYIDSAIEDDHYETSIQRVKAITQEIGLNQIKIKSKSL